MRFCNEQKRKEDILRNLKCENQKVSNDSQMLWDYMKSIVRRTKDWPMRPLTGCFASQRVVESVSCDLPRNELNFSRYDVI